MPERRADECTLANAGLTKGSTHTDFTLHRRRHYAATFSLPTFVTKSPYPKSLLSLRLSYVTVSFGNQSLRGQFARDPAETGRVR